MFPKGAVTRYDTPSPSAKSCATPEAGETEAPSDVVIDGVRLLLKTVALIRTSLGEGFVGHVGGDDFVAISGLEEAPHAAQRLACLFDECVPEFARFRRSELPTLSIGIVTTARREFASYAEVAAVAAEMKTYLKSETGRTLSRFAFDRRGRA